MDFNTIVKICDGTLTQCPRPNICVEHLLVDSRQLQIPSSSLFFAIKGHKQDGHFFLKELYDKGVRCFVVTEDTLESAMPNANIVVVSDTLRALQKLASSRRHQFEIEVLGIAGSNGKTIIKEWLSQLLADKYRIVKSPKSYNSQIGVPLSVWNLQQSCNLAIFEAGISQPNEMIFLEPIIQPTIGLFTNIGSAHDEGFESMEEKLMEKMVLFKNVKKLIFCEDHTLVYDFLQSQEIPTFRWSRVNQSADLFLDSIVEKSGITKIRYRTKTDSGEISIPFVDNASIENAIHCLSAMMVLGSNMSKKGLAFMMLNPVAMRLESIEGRNGCQIINDVYNADLESLAVALAFANQQTSHPNKTIILSDFLQQSQEPAVLYEHIAKMIGRHQFTRCIGVGEEVPIIKKFLDHHTKCVFFKTTEDLLSQLPELIFSNEVVLVKGARVFGLERVTEWLSMKQHSTSLEINLSALARNIKKVESILKPQTKIMAMVKAAAYGSGALHLARFLASRNIEYLAVAYADEGVELRRGGIELPIIVLNTEYENIPLLTAYDLEPEVFSLELLKKIVDHTTCTQTSIPIHIKLETGMHRLGLDSLDIDPFLLLLKQSKQIEVKSIFSHLSASDSQDERAFTLKQIMRFDALSTKIINFLPYKPIRHILNSSGIANYPEAQYDMVRLGIGMYGLGMPSHLALETILTLSTVVSQIKWVPKDSYVGYGRVEKAHKNILVATVAIGYADGLIRKAGNRRYALVVNGKLAPIIGNVCMDMTMIDVTGIKDVEIGTQVVVFGQHPSVTALAEAADTIPYEVFTSIGSRVKRVYTNE